MITRTETFCIKTPYPVSRLGVEEKILFFDIETTGFSAENSMVYLIGCIWPDRGKWRFQQWFADQTSDEENLLLAFFEFLKGFSTVVHFNGDSFDIPYLVKRCVFHNLPSDFTGVTSIDIYKKIRPYKNILGLESLKQKAVEHFLGIDRLDACSGGELISVYEDYLVTREESLFQLLILHNEDDLKGMPAILSCLSYPDFLESGFRLVRQKVVDGLDRSGAKRKQLKLTCQSEHSVPRPFYAENDRARLEVCGSTLSLTVPLWEGSLKYFYPNYKEYYFLIYEDRAIHKSVAEYVDRQARVKATAKTCYIKKEGLYLPRFSPEWEPAFVAEYRDKTSYFPYDEKIFLDPNRLNGYVGGAIRQLCR